VSWKPSDQRQWYATGSDTTNAAVPDQRCTGASQPGVVRTPGSLPHSASALPSWDSARTSTMVPNQAFMGSTAGNPKVAMLSPVGSWTRP
jgi:hypothetical protein